MCSTQCWRRADSASSPPAIARACVRKENGKEVTLKVKIDDLVNKGGMQYNIELRPGDVLVVPESRL